MSEAGLLTMSNRVGKTHKEGFLDKWSPSFFKGWQKRYIVLHEGTLKYFKEESNGEQVCCGTLNFELYMCLVTQNPSKKNQFMLTFNGNEREFEFRAKSAEEADSWC